MDKQTTDYAIHGERSYGILIAGHFTVEADYAIHRPSGSRDWLLIYTISGEGEIRLGQETVLCTAGDMAVLLPGMPHHYNTKGEGWEMVWAHFIPDPQWSTWLKMPGADREFMYHRIPSAELRETVQDALMRMVLHDLPGATSILHRRLAELGLEEALIHVHLNGNDDATVVMDSRISGILQDLQLNPAGKVSLPDLARRSCLSVSRLSHLFKEQVGDTILNTLTKFRMERAAQLLAATQRQVSEIAADTGFECAVHFTRKFRDTFGETPSQYRKRIRGEMRKGDDSDGSHKEGRFVSLPVRCARIPDHSDA